MDESSKEPQNRLLQEAILEYLRTYTEVQLMEEARVSRKTVDSWKTGKVKVPKLEMQERIVKVLGKSREELGFIRPQDRESVPSQQVPIIETSPSPEELLPNEIGEQRLEAQTQQQAIPDQHVHSAQTQSTSTPLYQRREFLIGLILAGIAAGGATSYAASRMGFPFQTSKNVTPTPTKPPAPPGTTLYTYHGHTFPVLAASWSPKGGRIASGGRDMLVQVWNASNGGDIAIYKGHTGDVQTVAWSPDSKRIASGSDDTTVQIWDASTTDNVIPGQGHTQW